MKLEDATDLLYTLARGIDPRNGETLAIDDTCNDVEVVRALYLALGFLAYTSKKHIGDPYFAAGKTLCVDGNRTDWSEDDVEMLMRMYEEGYEKQAICTYFVRDVDDVAAKLMELGLITHNVSFFRRR